MKDYMRTDPFRGGAKYHLDLCFYLGDDIKRSHVMCNAKWNNDTAAGWAQYINDLGFETETILSEFHILSLTQPRILLLYRV